MAQMKLEVRDTDRKVSGQRGIELTDEIFGKLSKANQTLICLYEKFIGDDTSVIEYSNGYGVSQHIVDAIIEKFKLD